MLSASENQWSLHSGEREGYRKLDSAFEGHVHKLTHSKSQHRGSRLKRAWIIRERNVLTNFRACTRRQVSGGTFSRNKSTWSMPFILPSFHLGGRSLVCTFLSFSINLLNVMGPTLTFPKDWHPPAHWPWVAASKQFLLHSTWQAMSACTGVLLKWLPFQAVSPKC